MYFDNNLDMHNIILSKCEKVLGIYIDEKLSFKEYVYECVNNAIRMCAVVLNNVKKCGQLCFNLII